MEMNKTSEECLQGRNDDFNDQHRPFRRRTIYWHTANVSAWGAHRRAIGR
jgi:hypothetical protein